MLSSMNLIEEYFLYPFKYPVANLVTVFITVTLLALTLVNKDAKLATKGS